MAATTTVQARIETKLKGDAEEILHAMGLSISDGMRLFLRQVVNSNGLPFQPVAKKPEAITVAALEEAKLGQGKQFTNTADLFAHLRSPNESTDN